jgi:hypothetical protein
MPGVKAPGVAWNRLRATSHDLTKERLMFWNKAPRMSAMMRAPDDERIEITDEAGGRHRVYGWDDSGYALVLDHEGDLVVVPHTRSVTVTKISHQRA